MTSACKGSHCLIGPDDKCLLCGATWARVEPDDVPEWLRPSLNFKSIVWKRQGVAGELYRMARD